MAIGRDLLDLPFAEMVRDLAVAIAEGQLALDRTSIETLRALVGTNVDIIPEIAEIVEPMIYDVPVSTPDPDNPGATIDETIRITGARVRASGVQPVTMNLLQAGLLPTFYQFTEAAIEVKLSITMREARTTETEGQPTNPGLLLVRRTMAYSSTVDYRTASTYSYQASGASVLKVNMRPVPPPSPLIPRTVTINTLTSPPSVVTVG
jgi:hypothetical protein